MALRFVELEEAKAAEGLRLVLLAGVPSPWSQAAKAFVEIDGVDALGVWMRAGDAEVAAWTGMPNAPVALLNAEPPRNGWAQILTLIERLSPEPRLIPEDAESRVEMHGLSHEVMGEDGLIWNARLVTVDASLDGSGGPGFAVPVAQYLGARYGYSPGCGERARSRVSEVFRLLEERLSRGRATGPYYCGARLSALDVYATAALDALVPLPDDQCAMHPGFRKAFSAQQELFGKRAPTALLEHRDMMHERHMPLPMALG
ncbi:MAG: hypothetical protein OXT09_36685 [Myxococcales bacterium]|nr:hypothetical protein [Myxococcales bacterium]